MQTLKQRRVLADYQTARERLRDARPPAWWLVWMRIKAFLFERVEW